MHLRNLSRAALKVYTLQQAVFLISLGRQLNSFWPWIARLAYWSFWIEVGGTFADIWYNAFSSSAICGALRRFYWLNHLHLWCLGLIFTRCAMCRLSYIVLCVFLRSIVLVFSTGLSRGAHSSLLFFWGSLSVISRWSVWCLFMWETRVDYSSQACTWSETSTGSA